MSTPTRSRRRRERGLPSEGDATRSSASPPDGAPHERARSEQSLTSHQRHDDEPRDTFWALARDDDDKLIKCKSVADVKRALTTTTERVWIDLISPDHDELADLSEVLGLHPLVVEDILESNQRAKIEIYPDALHIVMFGLTYEGEILAHEIDIVLGERYLLTSHDGDIDPRNAPFTKRDEGFHLSGGPDYVLWAIADWIVDGYFPVFDRLGDEIDELEVDVMRKANQWVVERL